MRRPGLVSGFSLVEVTLAIGVAAISLVAIFALLPVGLQTNQNAIQQTLSNNVMTAVASDLRATAPTLPRGNAATTAQYAINIPANPVNAPTVSTLYFDAEGHSSAALAGNSRYRLNLTFLPNSGSRSATLVNLKMTWPAAATPANALGSTELFIALDRN
jgi:uncharacterized protein (TIGR02598 family)